MAHRRQLLEHLHVRRRACLGPFLDGQAQSLEQHGAQLLRGVDVELAAGGAVEIELERRQLLGEPPRDLAQQRPVDQYARRLHLLEHRHERDLDFLEERKQVMILELRAERVGQPQHRLHVGGRNARSIGRRHLGKGPLAAPLAHQFELRGQLRRESLTHQLVQRVRAASRIEHEARQHRIVCGAVERDPRALQYEPLVFDVVRGFGDPRIRQQFAERSQRGTIQGRQVARSRALLELTCGGAMSEREVPRLPWRGGEREADETGCAPDRDQRRLTGLRDHGSDSRRIIHDRRLALERGEHRRRRRARCRARRRRRFTDGRERGELGNERLEFELGEQLGEPGGVGRLHAQLLEVERDRHVAPDRDEGA